MGSTTRQHSPTQYSVSSPAPDAGAIHKLVDACREAIREYDKSNDHRKHDHGADCIRCNVAAVVFPIQGSGPYLAQTDSLRDQQVQLRAAIELFPEMASGVRAYDDVLLMTAADFIRSVYSMAVTVEKAVDSVRRANEIAREMNRLQPDQASVEYQDLVNKHQSAVGDAESCARILHRAY